MAVVITSGDLRHKVVFKQPSSLKNDEGGKAITHVDAITTWAKVDKFNQYRKTESNATVLTGALDFYIRHSIERESIAKDWLIRYNGKDYTIHEIERIDQKEVFIRFTAKANS
jgi:SPP1 family predicted phage head-tail adaptor